jgi:Mg-chelatase subunit ChlD
MRKSKTRMRATLFAATLAATALAACGRAPSRSVASAGRPADAGQPMPGQTMQGHPVGSRPAVYQAEVEEGVGAAIMIVVDTSGSMAKPAPGDTRPKHEVAREALAKMLDATTSFLQKRSGFAIKVGVMHFSSRAWRDLPIQAYDREAVAAALARIPKPAGGTAIGDAMAAARPELYRSGVFRKHMIVVTDGENTSGGDPAKVAREIHARSEGSVGFHFVAFDTSPAKFGFLREVGGEVVAAGNSQELAAALKDIYEGRILAEADYGESGNYDPRQKQGAPR